MRIDQLVPDTDLVLTIGKTEKRTATFIGIQGEKTDRVAMFASPDDDGLYRWTAYRVAGYWRTGPLADSVKVDSIIRDPRYPEIESTASTTVQYGFQWNKTSVIDWMMSKEDAELMASNAQGRVVYRTVTYSEVMTNY